MTIVDQKLARLAQVIEQLPPEAQADVLAEIEARVESLSVGRLTDAQRVVVMERLAAPRVHARREDVDALLREMKNAG